MKNIALAILVAASIGKTCHAQQADGCQAPAYCPPACATTMPRSAEMPQTPRNLDTAPRGTYVRAPETGEQTGESTGYGLQGFGFRLPAISLDLPEIRMPRLVKYRRLPEMMVEGSRAPWVENRALEFNQVSPRDLDTTNNRALDTPTPRDTCIPPMPCVDAKERRLRDELARKDAEIEKIQSQLGRLETILGRLAEPEEEKLQTRATGRAPRIIEVSYAEPAMSETARSKNVDSEVNEHRPSKSNQKSAAPRPCAPIRRTASK